jgi:hypothetical protein
MLFTMGNPLLPPPAFLHHEDFRLLGRLLLGNAALPLSKPCVEDRPRAQGQAIYKGTYMHHSLADRRHGRVSKPMIFEMFDPMYHHKEILFDDGRVGSTA